MTRFAYPAEIAARLAGAAFAAMLTAGRVALATFLILGVW